MFFIYIDIEIDSIPASITRLAKVYLLSTYLLPGQC